MHVGGSQIDIRVLMDLRIPRIGYLRFWQHARNSPRGAHIDLFAESKGVFDTSVGGEPTWKCG